jgi:hypothetical protein
MTTQVAFQKILKVIIKRNDSPLKTVILHTEDKNKYRHKRMGILKSQEKWR